MKTKKARAAALTTTPESELQFEHYQKGKPMSSLQTQIGELLLFYDGRGERFWQVFEVKLRQYFDLRMSGDSYE
jgi:hypothetical protein